MTQTSWPRSFGKAADVLSLCAGCSILLGLGLVPIKCENICVEQQTLGMGWSCVQSSSVIYHSSPLKWEPFKHFQKFDFPCFWKWELIRIYPKQSTGLAGAAQDECKEHAYNVGGAGGLIWQWGKVSAERWHSSQCACHWKIPLTESDELLNNECGSQTWLSDFPCSFQCPL